MEIGFNKIVDGEHGGTELKPHCDCGDGPAWGTGRKRVDPKLIRDGIMFGMRTGCHWNPAAQGTGRRQNHPHRTLQCWPVTRGAGAHLGGVGRGPFPVQLGIRAPRLASGPISVLRQVRINRSMAA